MILDQFVKQETTKSIQSLPADLVPVIKSLNSHRGRSGSVPTVSISSSQIRFNRGLMDKFKKRWKFASVFFSPTTKTVVIQFSNTDHSESYAMIYNKEKTQGSIPATTLLRMIGQSDLKVKATPNFVMANNDEQIIAFSAWKTRGRSTLS